MLAVTATEQSYIFPHAITSIATTTTKYGISMKDIIGLSPGSLPLLNAAQVDLLSGDGKWSDSVIPSLTFESTPDEGQAEFRGARRMARPI